MKKIIVIVGPTGVGKTKLSIELAKKYDGEIINADSTQVYQELDIATAKVKPIETENIPHHLLNIKKPSENYTICDYQKDGRKILDQLLLENKTVIIVGGSGLYINSLLYDYQFENEEPIKIDIPIEKMYQELIDKGIEIDKNNLKRIERSYIKYIINNQSVNQNPKKLLYDASIIGLTTDRKQLYERINQRVDQMIDEGLIEEARIILNKYNDSKAINTVIGYKELKPYLDKKDSLENCLEKMKQVSRNYAKKQYTWFNNQIPVKWFDVNFSDFDKTVEEIIQYINAEKN